MSTGEAVLGPESKLQSFNLPFDLKALFRQPNMDLNLNVSLHLLKHVPSYTISSTAPH